MTKEVGTETCDRHQITHNQEVKYASQMCKILGEPSYTYFWKWFIKKVYQGI